MESVSESDSGPNSQSWRGGEDIAESGPSSPGRAAEKASLSLNICGSGAGGPLVVPRGLKEWY